MEKQKIKQKKEQKKVKQVESEKPKKGRVFGDPLVQVD
jgi:hypothetical protein